MDGPWSFCFCFFFSSRRRHTRLQGDWSSDVCFFSRRRRHTRLQGDWSSDVCSSDLYACFGHGPAAFPCGPFGLAGSAGRPFRVCYNLLGPVTDSPGKGLFRGFESMVSTQRKLQILGSFGILFFFALAVGCSGFFVDPQLVSIALSPPTPSLLVGGTGQQMTAIGTYDDGSKNYNLNSKVIWTMSPQGFATITPAGLLTGTAATTSSVPLAATVLDIS